MKRKSLIGLGAALFVLGGAVFIVQCTRGETQDPAAVTTGGGAGGEDEGGDDVEDNVVSLSGNLTAFASEDDFSSFVDETTRKMLARYRAMEGRRRARRSAGAEAAATAAPEAEPTEESEADESEDSVTNNQEQGVDEGGIVKVHGDHLVVLRRGRLFTALIGDDQLRPISMVDVTPPGRRGRGGWYDEMLISDDTIVVVGFSYQVGATELGLFEIDDEGIVRHRATHYLRSNDYYSSRNYASRLIGDQLIFYMPYFMFRQGWDGDGPTFTSTLPSVATHGEGGVGDWSEIVRAQRIYRPVQPTNMPVLHTVVQCDLSTPSFDCDATSIVGPPGRNFYVARDAVYVWVSEGNYGYHEPAPDDEPVTERRPRAAVYRLPLDGSRPGARRVWGNPVDQFSFKADGGHLNVLVRAEGGGDMMWAPEASAGAVGLLRMPLGEFGSASVDAVDASLYTTLAAPSGNAWSFQNRFVGDYVLYGTGSSWGWRDESADTHVYAYPYARGGAVSRLPLSHSVDRIEALGRNAVVVGTDGRDLHFSAVELGAEPRLRDRYTQEGASQGETRSHGFFFKPSGDDEGTLGLPIRGGGAPGFLQLRRNSAAILFLRVDDLTFSRVGSLASRSGQVNDHCVASCVDWYGNARPLFLRGRVFALLGYELVEGQMEDGHMTERRRVHLYRGATRR
jgi:hypothetical protein